MDKAACLWDACLAVKLGLAAVERYCAAASCGVVAFDDWLQDPSPLSTRQVGLVVLATENAGVGGGFMASIATLQERMAAEESGAGDGAAPGVIRMYEFRRARATAEAASALVGGSKCLDRDDAVKEKAEERRAWLEVVRTGTDGLV